MFYCIHILLAVPCPLVSPFCLTVEKRRCGLSQNQVCSIYTVHLERLALHSELQAWEGGIKSSLFPRCQAAPDRQDRPAPLSKLLTAQSWGGETERVEGMAKKELLDKHLLLWARPLVSEVQAFPWAETSFPNDKEVEVTKLLFTVVWSERKSEACWAGVTENAWHNVHYAMRAWTPHPAKNAKHQSWCKREKHASYFPGKCISSTCQQSF